MHHRKTEPCITTRIPREELLALLGRSVRGDEDEIAAFAVHGATGDRPAPIIVHRRGIEAWLARKVPAVREGRSGHVA